jgi:hypothetical protein
LGTVYLLQANPGEAEKLYKQALAITTKAQAGPNQDIALLMSNLADVSRPNAKGAQKGGSWLDPSGYDAGKKINFSGLIKFALCLGECSLRRRRGPALRACSHINRSIRCSPHDTPPVSNINPSTHLLCAVGLARINIAHI